MIEWHDAHTPSSCGTDNEEDLSAHALLALTRTMDSIAKERQAQAQAHAQAQAASGRYDYDAPTSDSSAHKPTKKRKSSSVVRKEEKAGLLEEISDLEKRLAFLNGEVFAPLCSSEQVDPNVSNSLLRETVKQQELRFAGARSILAQVACSRVTPPTQDYLHLGCDPAERRRQLLEIRPTVLEFAHSFITERFRHMDLMRPYSSEERFVTSSGENVVEFWDVHQVPTATSVAAVYSAMCDFLQKYDRTAAPPGMYEHEYVQRKFVMELEKGIEVEHNFVRFAELHEGNGANDDKDAYAMWACCPVSQDDLSPYSPNERYRRDLTCILLATKRKGVVVLGRYVHFRLFHARHITASQDVLEQVMLQWNRYLSKWVTYIQDHTAANASHTNTSSSASPDADFDGVRDRQP